MREREHVVLPLVKVLLAVHGHVPGSASLLVSSTPAEWLSRQSTAPAGRSVVEGAALSDYGTW